jgi:hypothetical protein
MKLILSLIIITLLGSTKIVSAQALLGFTAGYDDHYLQVGISAYIKHENKIFNRILAFSYSNNLDNKKSGQSVHFTIGHILCIGYDALFLFPWNKETYPFIFKPKIGLGLPKYGSINYGYNMSTNGDRYWTWSVDVSIPIYQLKKPKNSKK